MDLYYSLLASQHRGPGSIPGQDMSNPGMVKKDLLLNNYIIFHIHCTIGTNFILEQQRSGERFVLLSFLTIPTESLKEKRVVQSNGE
jgi:hypothetical protein